MSSGDRASLGPADLCEDIDRNAIASPLREGRLLTVLAGLAVAWTLIREPTHWSADTYRVYLVQRHVYLAWEKMPPLLVRPILHLQRDQFLPTAVYLAGIALLLGVARRQIVPRHE